jgi:2-polyprenyl-3-methyl-5-hydroxy-6-metoxy-1,4-benzoquinol methylase
MRENSTLFDETAAEFASRADRQIDSGHYFRGDLFLAAVVSSVPSEGYILDYGCGPGRISAILARRGFRVLGLDPSPVMIATARQQPLDALQVEFQLCPTCPVDAQQVAYDAIVCSSVIEYLPQPEQLLRWFSAALRPSGVLIISFANSRCLTRAWFKLRYRNPHLVAQKHMWSWRQFSRLLERSGFRPIRGAVYFTSLFDRFVHLRFLSASRFVGSLGLVVAVRDELGSESSMKGQH